ncbi:aminotransferase class V-fold PLP-dependent enzyme [Streptomyces sp. Je 1-79]|uniref:pyridoxal phosphate-dependent decarboxylase family protein n=1 Tax=Streptomyces sp. Je 1-79 TaxID=2943847 RepID=UPI0021A9297F|nr:aminotransferase class V-fold PLP-dependent enzyme [Streptomyces sp. Je 1-79]MCT4355138.1 aminotransferase class V-fold PLP-dependent enzyme [Streptomyces sp. Je 1-79]
MRADPAPPLATDTAALRPLLDTVLDALDAGATARSGPIPAGGPDAVTARVREALGPDALPETGTDPTAILHALTRALAEGAADPAHPLCAAHLHTPPLALAAAADLAACVLNPSMDSWDQAPAATALEALVTAELARTVYPRATTPDTPGPDTPRPDALVTTGGTEANQLALLLARERHGPGHSLQTVVGANAHHSFHRAAWLLGLPEPVTVPTPNGTLDPVALNEALTDLHGPLLVAATAGTTDTGRIDPLPEIADLCAAHRAELHVDAAYGGPLLFSDTHRALLTGLDRARTVTLDLHKLGWQPVAAGLLAVRDQSDLSALSHTADYLNATDDTEAGLPDLLGRSLRTTRRPDILKIAVTLRALGRSGIGALVDRVHDLAQELADLVDKSPALQLYERPTLTTVLFRPTGADDTTVAAIRRTLLTEGRAVLGRAHEDGRLWLKATLLNPHTTPDDLRHILDLVEGSTDR